jgi:hypothetical protein
MGLSEPEPPEDAARRVINGAYASAWRWAGRPLPATRRRISAFVVEKGPFVEKRHIAGPLLAVCGSSIAAHG